MVRPGATLLVAFATAVAVTYLLAFDIARTVELPVRDAATATLPSHPAASTIIVGIDEQSLRSQGRWPWSRTVLAQIVDRAADTGARAVILDVLLTEPEAGDARLAQAMRRIPTLAVAALREHGEWLLAAPALGGASSAVHGNFELDHDGIMRRVATTKQSGDRALTALSVRAASIITGAPIPVGRTVAPAFRTRPRDVPQISARMF